MGAIMLFEQIKIGDVLPEVSLALTQDMINEYAELSGDFNPIHVDLEAAAKSEFKGTIAHGTMPVEPIIQSIAGWLGVAWLPDGTEMHLRYRAPSRPGDRIRCTARVLEKEIEDVKQIVMIEFSCCDQNDREVITGTWKVTIT